jgi:hypothetical protein
MTTTEHPLISPALDSPHASGLLGSASEPARALRRPIDDDEVPGPDPGGDVPPVPTVSVPDAAFQIHDDITDGSNGCFPALIQQLITDTIVERFTEAFPGIDVRAACRTVEDGRRFSTFAIWTRPTQSSDADQARDRGLERLALVTSEDTIGMFVSASFIRRQVDEVFADIDKRYNSAGRPDHGGPVHLTGVSVRFLPPNQVAAVVSGYDERPWPDVNFTITITDTLSVNATAIRCETSDPQLSDDAGFLNALGYLVAVLASVAFGPLLFLTHDILEASPFSGSSDLPRRAGPAAAIAAVFFPPAFMLPFGQKLEVRYNGVRVTEGGMFASGTYELVAREPRVVVLGEDSFNAESGTAAADTYRARLTDLRGRLSYTWSAPRGQVVSPHAPVTSVRFPISGDPRDVLRFGVNLVVKDEDGLEARDTHPIIVRVVSSTESKKCQAKPWLPECR